MGAEKTRDITITICAIVFVLVYSASTLLPIFLPSFYYEQLSSSYAQGEALNAYGDCQTMNNTHMLTITLSNYGQDDLENVRCNLLDKAGLISSEDTQTVSVLGTQSTDTCEFKLDGTYEKSLKFEVVYGDKSIKQVAQCYPY
ncbi:hypothetical protein HYT57_00290 [Candidatus Woesearchaeota archaeon]|nr:hypothetical protein [Candidatus Woesearchaeota archaeon]